MKKFAILLILSAVALAGDDYVQTVAYTGTAACSTILRPKGKYSIRCTSDCHIMVSSDGSANTATTNHMLVSAGKLYDLPTTATQRFICAIQATAAGNAFVYLNRTKDE